ncbi:type IV pilus assembly protein PilM [Marinobacterium jannaschii]|uniref:type IV pilus assembly protein PilM n=1 Tax=Marinobacterium jannaschii TaxID=64970 RepID=UPI000483AF00|nr:type IV pilus assembly protein PilM [Marinobacterium jannaschii]
MFSLFGKKDEAMIGADIGSSAVKLVALSRDKDRVTLEAYAIVPLPPTAVIDGSVQDVAVVAEAIEQGMRQASYKAGLASVAVPSSTVITKQIEMSSALTELELEDQVRMEASNFIPYPLDEVALDFEIIGPKADAPEVNELLLVACRRDDVEQREDAVGAAGLKCEVVDVDVFAIERAYPLVHAEELEPGQLVGMVDIGASTLTLYVFQHGKIIYHREQAFGSAELINALSQHTGTETEILEHQLKNGELNSELSAIFIDPFRKTVAQQISRALQLFYSSGVHSSLNRLFLLGGCSAMPQLVEDIADELGITTEKANPFAGMAISPKLVASRLQQDAASLVKASGLAMRTPMS